MTDERTRAPRELVPASGEAATALDRLTETPELVGPAREQFKTHYFQWEAPHPLASQPYRRPAGLDRLDFPGFLFNDATFDGSTLGRQIIVLAFSVGSTVAVAPFVVLLRHVLRTVTVTKHTFSIEPFILREPNQVEAVD